MVAGEIRAPSQVLRFDLNPRLIAMLLDRAVVLLTYPRMFVMVCAMTNGFHRKAKSKRRGGEAKRHRNGRTLIVGAKKVSKEKAKKSSRKKPSKKRR